MGKRGDIATSGLCTVVYQGSCPVVVGQTLGDNRIRQDIAVALGIKTALAVPIRVNNTKSCFEKLITISHKLANDS